MLGPGLKLGISLVLGNKKKFLFLKSEKGSGGGV